MKMTKANSCTVFELQIEAILSTDDPRCREHYLSCEKGTKNSGLS